MADAYGSTAMADVQAAMQAMMRKQRLYKYCACGDLGCGTKCPKCGMYFTRDTPPPTPAIAATAPDKCLFCGIPDAELTTHHPTVVHVVTSMLLVVAEDSLGWSTGHRGL